MRVYRGRGLKSPAHAFQANSAEGCKQREKKEGQNGLLWRICVAGRDFCQRIPTVRHYLRGDASTKWHVK